MSQIGKFLLGGSGSALTVDITTDSGVAKPNLSNTINALGGPNINTEGSGSTVTINLDDDIAITSLTIQDPADLTATYTITTNKLDVARFQNFSPSGSGRVILNTASIVENGALYFDNKMLKSVHLLDGETLIGRTGATPLAGTLTAGSNISITNSPNNITISNGGIGSANAGSGFSTWNIINWEDYNEETSITMQPNNGYIVNWNESSSGPSLFLKFPDEGDLSIGDAFMITILNGYGDPDDSNASVYIDPTPQNYGIQSLYQSNDNDTFDISAFIRPITKNNGRPTISFVYVGNPGNNVGSGRNIFQVLQTFGTWRWDTSS